MNDKETNETIVKHFYNIPLPTDKTENLRQITIILPTMTVNIISSYESENIEYLSGKALELLNQMRKKE